MTKVIGLFFISMSFLDELLFLLSFLSQFFYLSFLSHFFYLSFLTGEAVSRISHNRQRFLIDRDPLIRKDDIMMIRPRSSHSQG